MYENYEKECEIFKKVCDDLKEIHAKKSATYGDSWKKRGELVSVFGNVARKFDRLENLASDLQLWSSAQKGETIENIEDTVIDLAVYSILWCTFLVEKRPEKYKKAIANVLGLK